MTTGTTMILQSNDGSIITVTLVVKKEILAECIASDGKFYRATYRDDDGVYYYREIVPIQLSEICR